MQPLVVFLFCVLAEQNVVQANLQVVFVGCALQSSEWIASAIAILPAFESASGAIDSNLH